MGEIVLSLVGALTWISLRERAKKTKSVPQKEVPSLSFSKNTSEALCLSAIAPTLGRPQKPQVDWKRYWELFSSDDELSELEKQELNCLRRGLHEFHERMMEEDRKKQADLKRALFERMEEMGVSDRSAFLVHREDYKRGSEKERDYLRRHRNFLFRAYDNRCARCSNDQNGLDIDHFFISKNEGGCYQMLRRDGFLVNNAIPLCESCNRSKSDRYYKEFFTPQQLLRVLEKNAKMNERLNESRRFKWKKESDHGLANQQV